MQNLVKWLNDNKFAIHLSAFILMILPPIALYFTAQQGVTIWIWALIAVVCLGNLLAVSVP